MKRLRYKKQFLKNFRALPKNVREELIRLEAVFKDNPFHPALHTKRLHGPLCRFYSFRVLRDYRVIFEFLSEDEIGFITVKHRKNVYTKL